MLVIYKTVPDSQIRQDGRDAVVKAREFLAANPKRRVITVGVWYGGTIKVRRSHVEEDIQAAVDAALAAKPQRGRKVRNGKVEQSVRPEKGRGRG